MQRRWFLIVAIIVAIILAGFAVEHRRGLYARAHRIVFGDQRPHLLVGQTMPILGVTTLGGSSSTIAARPGRLLYVNVFTTWCPDCVRETPTLAKLSRECAGKPVDIVGIDQQESALKVQGFADEYGLHYPIFIDNQDVTISMLGVHFIPTTFLVDDRGIVRANIAGPLTLPQMERLVQTGLQLIQRQSGRT